MADPFAECRDCGAQIAFLQRWWTEPHAGYSQWVVCDAYPNPDDVETFVEIEPDLFASVVRHNCPGRPKTPQRSYLEKRIFPFKEDFNG